VKYFINCGDVFHRNIVNQELVADIQRVCQKLQDNKIETYFIVGNHDEIAQKGRTNSLTTIKTVSNWDYINVIEKPTFINVGGNKYFFFCPHTSRSKHDGIAPDELVLKVWKEADKSIEEVIVFTHAEVKGAVSGAENIMLANKSFTIPIKLINDERIKKVFCGHIHKYQEIGNKVVIIGAPVYVDASEVNDKKGVLIYNF